MPELAIEVDIVIEQGATYRDVFELVDEENLPIPFDTDYDGLLQVREEAESEDVLLEMSTALGNIVIDKAAGTIKFELLASKTAELAFEGGVYHFHLLAQSDPTEEVIRLFKGSVEVLKGVIR